MLDRLVLFKKNLNMGDYYLLKILVLLFKFKN